MGGSNAIPPDITDNLKGVKGVNLAGVVVEEASYQYEICFKCHGDNPFSSPEIPRQIYDDNIRLKFDPSNPSLHPVTDIGKSSHVPSLRPELTTSSMIYCTDCHNNDTSSNLLCPIGSIYPHLLREQYLQDDYTSYTYSSYALCFRCHNPDILLSDQSTFPQHDRHVRQESIPCSFCHDPHGVPTARGANAINNAHLINFDTRFVTSGSYDSGARSCSVSCHSSNPRNY
jgi:cytochrome c553